MLKSTLAALVLPLILFTSRVDHAVAGVDASRSPSHVETIEKLIAVSGSVTMDLNLEYLTGAGAASEKSKVELHFALVPDSFFSIVVDNGNLRGPLPGAMGLIPQNGANLPPSLNASLRQLVLEKTRPDVGFDLVVRDARTGFVFFNVEGHQYDYEVKPSMLSIRGGRLLLSKEFAKQLGLPIEARPAGTINLSANLQPIEIRTVVNGEVRDALLPPLPRTATPNLVAGPDVIVGEIISVEQPTTGGAGVNGSFVGLGIGAYACNAGDQPYHWFGLPNNDHPVIAQNLYRMSGGSGNNERFEQIGQSWVKHSFASEEGDTCTFGCNTTGCTISTNLCPGCSDAYSANLNYQQSFLGSRAWINPFIGSFPRGDSPTPPSNHAGHTHTETSHRVTVAMSDLVALGATYFGEVHYVSPQEYAWCQTNPGQCNMYDNVSYRQFSSSTSDGMHFTFPPVGGTVRTQPALLAWTGATITQIEPVPGSDGIGFVGFKVTNPSVGVWHYEYALYNENLDRAIQSFSLPLGLGINVSNIGFHAPPQDPAFANDGTFGSSGYSSTPWSSALTSNALSWSSETFAQNQNANAIRWGTLYNFRFDSDRPPQTANATVGFFKTGSPITVGIQVPSPGPTPTPTPFGATPTPSPIPPTPSPTPTPTPVASVALPIAGVRVTVSNFSQPVVTSSISGSNNLVGFQGDFTFDSSIVSFQTPAVSNAGLTAGNWNVSGNVLSGPGSIRTLHITAQSNDMTPLSGSGTLFTLNMVRVSSTLGASTALTWAASPNDFVYIDSNFGHHPPASTPPGSITIQGIIVSGTVLYCSNPSPGPVPNVLFSLTGTSSGSTTSDSMGNYMLSTLASGGTYTITPSKVALAPAAPGINTIDLLAVQRHFLSIALLPPGCRLTAADANGDSSINTVDVIAIQRFFLGLSTGIGNVGTYKFSPASRSYPGITSDQTHQDYDVLIFGDVAAPFAEPGS